MGKRHLARHGPPNGPWLITVALYVVGVCSFMCGHRWDHHSSTAVIYFIQVSLWVMSHIHLRKATVPHAASSSLQLSAACHVIFYRATVCDGCSGARRHVPLHRL